MKKSKFLKTLAALTVGAVAAAGAISLAACGDGHEHATTHGWEKNSTDHWHVCEECEAEYEKAGHDWNGNTCSICGATKSTQGGPSSGGEVTAHTYNYSWTKLSEAAGYDTDQTQTSVDKKPLTQANFTGDNAFLTILDESAFTQSWRCYKQAKGAFEIKGEVMSVTFQGTGTITITFCSTGGSNVSGFALVKPDDTWLEATSTTATKLDADETIADGYVNKAGLYTVTGTSTVTITYTITAPGTYKFYSSYSYYDSGKSQNSSRGCRISGVAMTDNY